jgi:hypothetical protein
MTLRFTNSGNAARRVGKKDETTRVKSRRLISSESMFRTPDEGDRKSPRVIDFDNDFDNDFDFEPNAERLFRQRNRNSLSEMR